MYLVNLGVAPDGHLRIERWIFRQIPYAALRLDRLMVKIEAVNGDAPLARRQIPRNHAHRGRLARAVRPEKPQHFAGLHVEGQVVDRHESTVLFRQMGDGNHNRLISADVGNLFKGWWSAGMLTKPLLNMALLILPSCYGICP
jgi:hypothetical protein